MEFADYTTYLFLGYFVILAMSSQLNHIAIKAIQRYPSLWEDLNKPEPALTVGIFNLDYKKYLIRGQFESPLAEEDMSRLKRARVSLLFGYLYFFSVLLVIIFL